MFSVRLLTFISQLLLALAVLYIPYQFVLGGNLSLIPMVLWIGGFVVGSAFLGTLAFIAENVAVVAENSSAVPDHDAADDTQEQNKRKIEWNGTDF